MLVCVGSAVLDDEYSHMPRLSPSHRAILRTFFRAWSSVSCFSALKISADI